MEMFYVNIFLFSALFDRGAVRLFLFTGQLSKDQVDIKKRHSPQSRQERKGNLKW